MPASHLATASRTIKWAANHFYRPSLTLPRPSPSAIVAAFRYAMSECAPICSNPRYGTRKLSSVGLPAGSRVRLLGVDGSLLEVPGEVGEVVVKGASAMLGYLPAGTAVGAATDDGSAVADTFTPEGWLRTGDLGFFDSDGYLTLSGRMKEVINRGGEKISPLAVEEVLIGMECIQECIVFSVPHEELGEEVAVGVVLTAG